MEINKYKYGRKYIAKTIMLSPQTKMGVYWSPEATNKLKNVSNGKYEDTEYFIPREYFYGKLFYTIKDINYLLAKGNNQKLHVDEWIKKNKQFNEDNKDLTELGLKDTIDASNNTVERVIDMYLLIKLNYFFEI